MVEWAESQHQMASLNKLGGDASKCDILIVGFQTENVNYQTHNLHTRIYFSLASCIILLIHTFRCSIVHMEISHSFLLAEQLALCFSTTTVTCTHTPSSCMQGLLLRERSKKKTYEKKSHSFCVHVCNVFSMTSQLLYSIRSASFTAATSFGTTNCEPR